MSTESWRPIEVGQVGPFGTITVASPRDIPADAAVKIALHHGPGGGENSHMWCEVDGVRMESNGTNGCVTGNNALPIDSTYGNDWAYLPGPIEGEQLVTLYGPDLSNNNWSSTAEIAGWLDQTFHKEGFTWMEHKVSEGSYFADAYWPTVRDWCNANNVPVIGYHYVTTDDPHQQAQKFVSNGGGANAMLDFEQNSGNISNFWNVVNAFNAAGVNIALSYIPHWYWQQIGSPDLSQVPGLISSNYVNGSGYASVLYPGDSGAGWAAYGGATPAIWQFTSQALIAGKSVDANAFKGSVDDLVRLLGGTPPVNPPPPNQPQGVPVADATSIQADVSGVDVASGTPDPWRMVASRHERGPADVVNDPARGPWTSEHNGKHYDGHFDAFEQIVPMAEQISWVHTFSDGVERDLGYVLMELMEDMISRRKAAGEPPSAFGTK